MKNAISYYYNITANVIHQTGKTFKFTNNGENYILTTCEREDIDDIYELSYNLIKEGVLCHQIILNNSNSIITNINNLPYILMKVLVNNDKITLNDIINFNNTIITVKLDNLRRDNWFNLWCNKVDYFEYQVNQMGKKYPIIRESFSYYIGLAEIGISLFKNTSKSEKLSLSHRRILYGQSLTELYNPINLIIDGMNSFIKGLNKIKIPDWVPGVGGKGLSISLIKKLRVGMDYVPYDEMPALLHKGEQVLTADEAKDYREEKQSSITNNETTNNFNLTINSTEPLSPAETARKTRKVLQEYNLKYGGA